MSARPPLRGVANVVRFNWPVYLCAGAGVVLGTVSALTLRRHGAPTLAKLAATLTLLGGGSTLASLAATHWAYDRSDLFRLTWLPRLTLHPGNATPTIATFDAGFDEIGPLLRAALPEAHWLTFDFFDPERHTEPSIARARRAYPPLPGTRRVETTRLPVADGSLGLALCVLSAHEIREESERALFFAELARAVGEHGRVLVVEHLRDVPNALAYSVGVTHFHSRGSWLRTFAAAKLTLAGERQLSPFLTVFTLRKRPVDGATA